MKIQTNVAFISSDEKSCAGKYLKMRNQVWSNFPFLLLKKAILAEIMLIDLELDAQKMDFRMNVLDFSQPFYLAGPGTNCYFIYEFDVLNHRQGAD